MWLNKKECFKSLIGKQTNILDYLEFPDLICCSLFFFRKLIFKAVLLVQIMII